MSSVQSEVKAIGMIIGSQRRTQTDVTVGTQLAGEFPCIRFDRVQLQQVMLNLIVNAIQSMSSVEDDNRELQISTVNTELEGVCVAVRDTGHGLCPEIAASPWTLLHDKSPMARAWAARLSKPMVSGCGRLDASRGILSSVCDPR